MRFWSDSENVGEKVSESGNYWMFLRYMLDFKDKIHEGNECIYELR